MSGPGVREISLSGPSGAVRAAQDKVLTTRARVEELQAELEVRQLERQLEELSKRAAGSNEAVSQKAASSVDGVVLAEVLRAQARITSAILERALDRASAPDSELAAIREELRALREERRGGLGAVGDFVQLLTVLRDLLPEIGRLLRPPGGGGGAAESEPVWLGILRELAPQVLPQVLPQILGRLQPSGVARAGAAPAPAPAVGSAAPPAVADQPGDALSSSPGVPLDGSVGADVDLGLLRQGIAYLKHKCLDRNDPRLWSDVILNSLSEPIWKPIVRLVETLTVEKLAELTGDSEITQPPFRAWFERLLAEVKAGLSEVPEEGAEDGVDELDDELAVDPGSAEPQPHARGGAK
jgi:hypothetical protein